MFGSKNEILTLINYSSGEISNQYNLDKVKLLVGSSPNADIHIDDPRISHYHAFVIVSAAGCKVIDLESDNGVFINGERVSKSDFYSGDRVQFANMEFLVEELSVEKKVKIEDQDGGKVQKLELKEFDELMPELPPLPGMVVIDGEYCDIVFNESSFSPVNPVETLNNFDNVDYINVSKESTEAIYRSRESLSVEVAVLSNGNILDIQYLPLKDVQYNVSGKSKNWKTIELPILEGEASFPLLTVNNGKVSLHDVPDFSRDDFHKAAHSVSLEPEDIINYHNKTTQIIVRLSDSPPSVRINPFFQKDKAFYKEASKVFGAFMAFMLILLLIDLPEEPKEEKKIAVIYRKAVKSKQVNDTKTSSEVSKVEKDQGVMKKDHEKKKIKKAMAGNKSPKKTPKKAPKKTKPKKLAKATKQKPIKKPKMKAYKFKMNNSLSSFMSNSTTKVNNNIKANRGVASVAKFNTSVSASKNLLKDSSSSQVGNLGSSLSGNYNTSSGAKGLASKGGIDTTYSAPKTVVLGSMDPDLLRKILREYLPQFRHCYQQELERNEDIKGVLDMNFRIGKGGKVVKTNIKAKDSRFSKGGINCMAGVLKIIDFPTPKGGGIVDVRQPLNFFAEKSKI